MSSEIERMAAHLGDRLMNEQSVFLAPETLRDLVASTLAQGHRISHKKAYQIGKPVGVLVENEAGAFAAVHDLGRVTWLDDCVAGPAACSQPPSSEVPEGYVLIPTDHLPPAMEAAAIAAAREYMERTGGNCMKTIYRALVTAAVPPKTVKPIATDWKAVHDMADEYVAGYEFRGDEGDYHPNDQERFLIEDCVAGLMHEVQELVTAKQKEREGA